MFRCMKKFLNWFKNLFSCDSIKLNKGKIVLGFGKHEVHIECECCPKRVSVLVKDPCDGQPVCGGEEENSIGIKMLCNGFLILADIKTNSCSVEWECA